uniref:Ig-like domain-containing protein n=1 Tax=Gouania willdenowi TaxID=441366 RepID=A0A8C5DTL7_GOUWI
QYNFICLKFKKPILCILERSSSSISVVVGHSVTFSCVYDIKHYGPLPVCWGRGQIPIRGCDQRLLSTDAHQVIEDTRASSRYQLLGELDRGDVSLTILNISEADAETYGCRVEIPGWFNDHKHHFELRVGEKDHTCMICVGGTGENTSRTI